MANTVILLLPNFADGYQTNHWKQEQLKSNGRIIANKLAYSATVILMLLLAWQMCVWIFRPPEWYFPSPQKVFSVFHDLYGYLFSNLLITVKEMLIGFCTGSLAGIFVALVLSHFKYLDRYLMPVVVVTQTLPVFAIAPLLALWFGLGIGSKIVMASLIIFFPVASSFYDGLKSTPTTYLDLAKSWRMSDMQTLLHFRVPAALPSLVSGLKIGATITPIGAIVGEWVGAAGGLGFVMVQANARTQTAVVFAAVILLAISAWILRWVVVWFSNRLVWWSSERIT